MPFLGIFAYIISMMRTTLSTKKKSKFHKREVIVGTKLHSILTREVREILIYFGEFMIIKKLPYEF